VSDHPDYIISVIRARAGDEFADSVVVPASVFVEMMTILSDLEERLEAPQARADGAEAAGWSTHRNRSETRCSAILDYGRSPWVCHV
jgi:hypothetical protein